MALDKKRTGKLEAFVKEQTKKGYRSLQSIDICNRPPVDAKRTIKLENCLARRDLSHCAYFGSVYCICRINSVNPICLGRAFKTSIDVRIIERKEQFQFRQLNSY